MKYLILLILLGFSVKANSQTLWDVDITDYSTPLQWSTFNGILAKPGKTADFDGVRFIPTVGYVFYYDEATIDNYKTVYTYLNQSLGTEAVIKDYIPEKLKGDQFNDKLGDSIKEGYGFIYREWHKENYRVRIFWNQFRFWVETQKLDS